MRLQPIIFAGIVGLMPVVAGSPSVKLESHHVTCRHAKAPFCWPTSVSANHRYLLDQTGRPYMVVGDSPQSPIGELSESEANTYFADRHAHGFNSALIDLLCTWYTGCGGNGSTYDGIKPFHGTASNPFANPNPAYFKRAAAMIRLAGAHGISVFLDPAETGGWLGDIDQAGAKNDFKYGVYVANRFKTFHNIIWSSGNDFQSWQDGTDNANVLAISKGIRSVDHNAIQTIELNYAASSSLDDRAWAPTLRLNMAYTYYPTYAEVLHAYNQSPRMPVFLGEANYENEDSDGHETGGPYVLRLQEYWTMTSGATGQLYGDHDTWDDGTDWAYESKHLDTVGVTQLKIMAVFFDSLPWYKFVPDQAHKFLTAGYGTFVSAGYLQGNDYCTAALTSDGNTGVIYLPAKAAITVNLAKMTGKIIVRWFNPTNGKYTYVGRFANSGKHNFTSPGAHSDGFDDWVLLLRTSS